MFLYFNKRLKNICRRVKILSIVYLQYVVSNEIFLRKVWKNVSWQVLFFNKCHVRHLVDSITTRPTWYQLGLAWYIINPQDMWTLKLHQITWIVSCHNAHCDSRDLPLAYVLLYCILHAPAHSMRVLYIRVFQYLINLIRKYFKVDELW